MMFSSQVIITGSSNPNVQSSSPARLDYVALPGGIWLKALLYILIHFLSTPYVGSLCYSPE